MAADSTIRKDARSFKKPIIATGQDVHLFCDHLAKKTPPARLLFFGIVWYKLAIGWFVMDPPDVPDEADLA